MSVPNCQTKEMTKIENWYDYIPKYQRVSCPEIIQEAEKAYTQVLGAYDAAVKNPSNVKKPPCLTWQDRCLWNIRNQEMHFLKMEAEIQEAIFEARKEPRMLTGDAIEKVSKQVVDLKDCTNLLLRWVKTLKY